MLTRFHKILIAALAIQLVLAVVVLTRGNDNAVVREQLLVPGFDASKVARLQVFGPSGDGKPIDLVKRDAGWVLASGFDFPVDANKVADALAPIAKLAAAAPIATQASRHKQLRVGDADFERKLVISFAGGGKDLTLFVGNAAGGRRNAVRLAGSEDVYGVAGLSAGNIGAEPRAWIDPSYVKVPRDEVAKVSVQRDGKTTELVRGAAWTVSIAGAPVTPAAGETLDASAIERFVDIASAIDATAPADPKRDASKPTATIAIERKAPTPAGEGAGSAAGSAAGAAAGAAAGSAAGSAAGAAAGSASAPVAAPPPVVIDVIADGASYWVHDRSSPRAVLVDKARIDDLLAIDRDKVIKKPAPAGAAPPSLPGGMPQGALPPGFDPSMLQPQ